MPRGKKNPETLKKEPKSKSNKNVIDIPSVDTPKILETDVMREISEEKKDNVTISASNEIKEEAIEIIDIPKTIENDVLTELSDEKKENVEIQIVKEDPIEIIETPIIIEKPDFQEIVTEEQILNIIETPIIISSIILEEAQQKKEINNIIEELKDEISLHDNKFFLQESTIQNILGEDKTILNDFLTNNNLNSGHKKYSLSDLKKIFSNFADSLLLIQIIDKKIKFIEKKNNADSKINQEIINMVYKLNSDFEIPNIHFLVATKKTLSNSEQNIVTGLSNFLIFDELYQSGIHDVFANINSNSEFHNNEILTQSIFYTLNSVFYKERIDVLENSINFYYQGSDLEIIFNGIGDSSLKINIFDNNTTIYYNNLEILKKYTPMILNGAKSQNYKISIVDKTITILVEGKFNLVKAVLDNNVDFVANNVDIMSVGGGWWIV